MKALKIVIIILVVIVAIILIPPLFMPSQLNIEVSRVLKAQPEVIWSQVNCLENWEKWDIWHQDTNMAGHYEGPACGEGAKNVWTYKNMEEGGSQTIIESREFEYIKTFLDFQKMGTAESEIFFEKVEDGTKITWTLVSEASYPVRRWVNALMVIPGVNKAYTEGLANLDELTKDMKPEPAYQTGEFATVSVDAKPAIVLRIKATGPEIGNAMEQAFGQLMAVGATSMAGYPFSIWYDYMNDTMEFDCGLPVAAKMAEQGDIRNIMTYGGRVATVTHTGTYESTQYSWEKLQKYMQENNLEPNGDPYEVYITDPSDEPDSTKWVTKLFWPVK